MRYGKRKRKSAGCGNGEWDSRAGGRLDIVGWKGKVKLSEREREEKGKKKTMLKLQLLWPLFAAFLDRLGGYGGKGWLSGPFLRFLAGE